jgi:glycosyltransferase involved in cell wall biosynthesis
MNYTLIIPIYNEINSIKDSIAVLENFLKNRKYINCIIVNDGSTDGTEDYLNKINHERIRVLDKVNGGYGSAIKYGSKYVETKYFGIIDADGTYPIDEFDNMTENLESYDMVVGSRTSKNSSIPIIKKIPKFFLKILCSYLTNRNILDFNSGMRFFKTSLFRKYITFIPDGFSLTTTLTVIFASLNLKIKFHQIDYFDRPGKSKIRPIRDTIMFFLTITKLGIFLNPFRLYGPLIIFFFSIGLLFLIYRYIYGEGFLIITIISFLISFLLIMFSAISSAISQLLHINISAKDD